jgi:ABC-type phosphate transport system substrate-binding protein
VSRSFFRVSVLAVALAAATLAGAAPSRADGDSPIFGSGSSWAANAVLQWVADVQQSRGLHVNFNPSGSATGRADFRTSLTDFGVSEIPFQGTAEGTGVDDTSRRPYAFVPITSGGTSFPYHILQAGVPVTNLRLSGLTLAKIFTLQITNWSDKEITDDNNGRQLPSLPIIPVVHSEGSGTTAQLTRFFASQYPNLWGPFNHNQPVMTEFYPVPANSSIIAQNGSDGVMTYVASAAANGAIGVDEYSYPKQKGYPTAKIENAAGYYTLPTQYNVAVALTQAKIDYDDVDDQNKYLTQNLDGVYTNPDARTYPLSSYSYGIIPTGTNSQDSFENTGKRQAITDFLSYALCQGQQGIGAIGYSALPVNLVDAAFLQVAKLHDADQNVVVTKANVANCRNPTFIKGQPDQNYLALVAPQPQACDKDGQGPCGSGPVVRASTAATGTKTKTTGKTATKGSPGGTTEPGTAGGAARPAGTTATDGTAAAGATTVDPATGQVVQAAADPDTGEVTDPSQTGQSPTLAATQLPTVPTGIGSALLGPAAAVEVLAVIVVPPLLVGWVRRRRRSRSSP